MSVKQVVFHQLPNGKWKFKCGCKSDGDNQHFNDRREAELAHNIHWVGCIKRFGK